MGVDLESLGAKIRDELHDLERRGLDQWELAKGVVRIGTVQLTLHGSGVLPTVRFECLMWWRNNMPTEIGLVRIHGKIAEAIVGHLDWHAEKRRAMGS